MRFGMGAGAGDVLVGGLMSAALAWAGIAVAVCVLLFSVYLVLVYRAVRNERVIGMAIAAMHSALADEPPPQQALLGAVADTLAEQERAAARIEVTIHELAQDGDQPPPQALLGELFALPEPHLLIADFLGEFGGAGSGAIVASVAADLLQAATLEIFGDLADRNPVQLERLLLLAAEGKIVPVAQAAWDAPGTDVGPCPYRGPRAADVGLTEMLAIVQALDRAVRRQLRLITLLHGQAEAILRLQRHEQRGAVLLWARVRQAAHFPLARSPRFQPGDLAVLVTTFDAVGEIVDTAEKRLAQGESASAVHLLAGLRVPVPEGLPGRIYHQECLAQVRPLATVAVRHRLAVSRWAAAALQTAPWDQMNPSALSGSMSGSTDRGAGDECGDAR